MPICSILRDIAMTATLNRTSIARLEKLHTTDANDLVILIDRSAPTSRSKDRLIGKKSMIVSIRACKTWKRTITTDRRMNTFHQWYLRRILKITWQKRWEPLKARLAVCGPFCRGHIQHICKFKKIILNLLLIYELRKNFLWKCCNFGAVISAIYCTLACSPKI